jgi:hypothetical protein
VHKEFESVVGADNLKEVNDIAAQVAAEEVAAKKKSTKK